MSLLTEPALPAVPRLWCQWAGRLGRRGLATGSVLMCEGRGAPALIHRLTLSSGHQPWQQTPWWQRANGEGRGSRRRAGGSAAGDTFSGHVRWKKER